VGAILQEDIYHFKDFTSFVWKVVYIEDRDRVQDYLGIKSLKVDKTLVYEVSHSSIV